MTAPQWSNPPSPSAPSGFVRVQPLPSIDTDPSNSQRLVAYLYADFGSFVLSDTTNYILTDSGLSLGQL